MEPLFACTKCHSRHPFEELSEGEQLCKDCRNNYPIVKCTYCRAEFQQEDKNGTSSICKKCAHNIRVYGKPKACEYCNIIAAFIGNKCQRCANSEKKYGPPQTCEQCKQSCAFDRRDESRKRVDGKLLCWLCTMAYKRVLLKTRSKGPGEGGVQNMSVSSSSTAALLRGSTTTGSSGSGSFTGKGSNLLGNKSGSSSGGGGSSAGETRDKTKDKETKEQKSNSSSSSSQKHKATDTPEQAKSKDGGDSTPTLKKPKLEKSTTNGLIMSKSTDSLNDFGSSENMVAITQLREEVESLKRQLQARDQQILDRDKKITEIKALNFEEDKKMRAKISTMQKKGAEDTESLQTKNRELQKQIKLLSKTTGKKNISPPS